MDILAIFDPGFSRLVASILFHTFWQSFFVAGLGFFLVRKVNRESAENKYQLSMLFLLACFCLPLLNVVWLTSDSKGLFSEKGEHFELPIVSLSKLQKEQVGRNVVTDFMVENRWIVPVYDSGSLNSRKSHPTADLQSGSLAQSARETPAESDLGHLSPNESGQEKSAIEKDRDDSVLKANQEETPIDWRSSLVYPREHRYEINWWAITFSTISFGYFVGLGVFVFRLFFSSNLETKYCLPKQCLDNRLAKRVSDAMKAATNRSGFNRKLSVRYFSVGPLAAVQGLFRPVLVMNASLISGLSPVQLEMILVHEIVHLIKWDLPALWFQRFTETILFFCPQVKVLGQRVSELREIRCDAQVARIYDPVKYADALVSCVGLVNQRPTSVQAMPFGLQAIASATSLFRERIFALLDSHQQNPANRKSVVSSKRLMLTGCIGTLAIMFFASNPGFIRLNFLFPKEMGSSDEVLRVDQDEWQWVFPSDEQISRQDFRLEGTLFETVEKIPDRLSVSVAGQGERRYLELQVGDSSASKVAMMLIQNPGQKPQLYCDLDRDRVIETEESCRKIALEKCRNVARGGFLFRVDAIVNSGKKQLKSERMVLAIPGQDDHSLQIHFLGYAEGSVSWNEKNIVARRYDRDGDGIPIGANDLFELDLNEDGAFDWANEQFFMQRQIGIGGKKFEIFSDRMGEKIEIVEVKQTGKVKLDSPVWRSNQGKINREIVCFEVTVENEIGLGTRLTNFDGYVSMSPGKYRVVEVSVQVRDSETGLWAMDLFGDGMGSSWFEVTEGGEKSIEVLENFRLEVSSNQQEDFGKGQHFIRPLIKTSDGLRVFRFDRETKETQAWGQGEAVSFAFDVRKGEEVKDSVPYCQGFM